MTLRSWDTATGKQLRAIPLPQMGAFGEAPLTVSPDGELAMIVERSRKGDPQMTLCDLVAERQLGRFRGHGGSIQELAFSPDGKRLATASRDTTALVWDIQTARILGLWSFLGEDERVGKAMAANLDDAVPFLLDRVQRAAELERAFSRRIDDLGSDDPAVADRAEQLLASDATTEFSLRLAVSTHPKVGTRERAAKTLGKLTAARPGEVDRLAAIIQARERQIAYADVKFLGPAAEATFNAACDQALGKRRVGRPEPHPFMDHEHLAAQLPPAAVLRSIRLLASSAAPEADRYVRELARGPENSRLAQEARTALAEPRP